MAHSFVFGTVLAAILSVPIVVISYNEAASTPMVSLWQNNLTGLRAERFFGVQKLTSTGVAVCTSVSYSGDSPGP